jgi:hypothetical protein
MLDTLVQQLGNTLNRQDQISTEEPGHYTLSFEGDLKIDAVQYPHNFVFKSNLEAIPSQNAEDLLAKAMEANLYGRGTRGAALGLNAEGTHLTLSMDLENNSSYKVFQEKLEDFISIAEYWRKEILALNK